MDNETQVKAAICLLLSQEARIVQLEEALKLFVKAAPLVPYNAPHHEWLVTVSTSDLRSAKAALEGKPE